MSDQTNIRRNKRLRRMIPKYTMAEICGMCGVDYDTSHPSHSIPVNIDGKTIHLTKNDNIFMEVFKMKKLTLNDLKEMGVLNLMPNGFDICDADADEQTIIECTAENRDELYSCEIECIGTSVEDCFLPAIFIHATK